MSLILMLLLAVYIGIICEQDNKKTKGNPRGTEAKGQIHKIKVDAKKGMDVRPRKARSAGSSKKAI